MLINGKVMHGWLKDLFPINRSITGPGVRETLAYLSELMPDMRVHSVPSGTPAFDWVVPDEWTIRDAWILDQQGNEVVNFKSNNLHVVGYSIPVNQEMPLEELQLHLHSLPDQPTAIPYVTSYYERRWGFCLAHEQRVALRPGVYKVFIDSEIKPGVLNYGELLIRGESDKEIFLSTYICHPSMANNELSGPVVTTALALWLLSLEKRHFSYRIVFVPETIGSLVYLSRHLKDLQEKVVAGFNITCVGDERCYSYLPSRNGFTLSDRVAQHVLKHVDPDYKAYTWMDRGSDERQYCAPGIDLPVASVMRSKYGEYPEYHTSLDDFTVVTPVGLDGAFRAYVRIIDAIENNCVPTATRLGEPQLGKYGLYPGLSVKARDDSSSMLLDILSLSDGSVDLLDIANIIGEPIWALYDYVDKLESNGLLEIDRRW